MMMALKITADKMADFAEYKFITSMAFQEPVTRMARALRVVPHIQVAIGHGSMLRPLWLFWLGLAASATS